MIVACLLLSGLAHVDGVAADAFHHAGDDAIIGEVKRLQLDPHSLALADKPDVFVHDIGLNDHGGIIGDDDHQRLRRLHHAANGGDGKLLHGA